MRLLPRDQVKLILGKWYLWLNNANFRVDDTETQSTDYWAVHFTKPKKETETGISVIVYV